jgi:hypothetical protein
LATVYDRFHEVVIYSAAEIPIIRPVPVYKLPEQDVPWDRVTLFVPEKYVPGLRPLADIQAAYGDLPGLEAANAKLSADPVLTLPEAPWAKEAERQLAKEAAMQQLAKEAEFGDPVAERKLEFLKQTAHLDKAIVKQKI